MFKMMSAVMVVLMLMVGVAYAADGEMEAQSIIYQNHGDSITVGWLFDGKGTDYVAFFGPEIYTVNSNIWLRPFGRVAADNLFGSFVSSSSSDDTSNFGAGLAFDWNFLKYNEVYFDAYLGQNIELDEDPSGDRDCTTVYGLGVTFPVSF